MNCGFPQPDTRPGFRADISVLVPTGNMEISDWRLEFAPESMAGAGLQLRRFKQTTGHGDHEHCVLCWQEIAEPKVPKSIQYGYVINQAQGREYWICPVCAHDFSEHFGWSGLDSVNSHNEESGK